MTLTTDWRGCALLALVMLGLASCAATPGQTDASGIASAATAQTDDTLEGIMADFDAWSSRSNRLCSSEDAPQWSGLPDVSPGARAGKRQALATFRSRLATLPGGAGDGDATNLRVLNHVVADQIERVTWDEDRIPFDNSYGFHTTATYGLYDDDRSSAERLCRLEVIPAFLYVNIANMRRGLATGMVASGETVDLVAAAMRVQRDELADKARGWPMVDTGMADLFAASVDGALAAFDRTITFLETDYRRAVPDLRAARDQTDGEDWYRSLVRHHTSSAMTPDEIHALGLSEVARIRARMEEEIAASGFDGTFADYLAFLRTDPQFYATTPEDLLEKAALTAKRIDDHMPELFATLPRLSYGVRPVPDDIAPRYTTGRYWRGSPAEGKAGGYMVNTHALNQRPLYELPALTLHEAVPGHHHQIALSQELDGLPQFRRDYHPTAFVEGWGLYAESLGEEIGFYRTPEERFGRLSYEMWRACRLVADTGIHWKGWSVAQARACFDENTALSALNITTELERYVAWPGQALAYKVGELEFRRLRAKAETALGDAFDLRAFHDVLLTEGALPFDAVEANVDAWIARQATP